MDDGELEDAEVFTVEPPADRDFPRVCEEEMEIEDEQTGPTSQAVQRCDGMKFGGFRRLSADPMLQIAWSERYQQSPRQRVRIILPIFRQVSYARREV